MPAAPSTPYARLLARLEESRRLGVEFGLERMRAALAALGDPHLRLRTVQIAGTNGKGSTAAMTEAMLRAGGLRTGLFTSPHLARFTERIQVAGLEADGDRLAALDARIEATGVPLTYFEIATALAFLLMAEEGVEAAVLETGLGGRLDAVTVCAPVATAITSIGLDHTDLLGDTLAAIAREKAGIAKPGVPLFLGPLPAEADAAIAAEARRVGAPLRRFGVDFDAPGDPLALAGPHQATNAALAVALARALADGAGRPLGAEAIAAGLSGTRWPGRLERIAPDVLLDGAHNAEGAEALAAALVALPERPRLLVLSMVRGKDVAGVVKRLLPHFDAVFLTRAHNDRALPTHELRPILAGLGVTTLVVEDPETALDEARRRAAGGGLVVVAGSLFLVGQLRARLRGEAIDPGGGDPLP